VRNVNLGSNWPHYFIKAAENSATICKNFSFQIYTKSVKLPTGKGKGKGHTRTDREGPEGEQMYSFTLALTPALDGGEWLTSSSGRFKPLPGKELVPTVGWVPGPV
jgi:hypothetical protein